MSSEIQMKVKIKKSTLLTKLKENRTVHKEIYVEAEVGYRKEVPKALRKLAEDIEGAAAGDKPIDVTKFFGYGGKWVRPTHHLAEYDRAIRMLEMGDAGNGDEEVITLTVHDFSKFVDDDWEFKDRFIGHSSNYSNLARMALDEDEDD